MSPELNNLARDLAEGLVDELLLREASGKPAYELLTKASAEDRDAFYKQLIASFKAMSHSWSDE